MAKWVYGFGGGRADGSAAMKELLGGKGANLAEMANLKLPVPPGFTITTEVCTYFYANERSYPPDLKAEVETALGAIADQTGKIFGDKTEPLLVSVRSGARASMPGMMDTVLNLGLNDETVNAIAGLADERFAWDTYRRFIQMYGSVVLGVEHHEFESILELEREKRGVAEDTGLDAEAWKAIVAEYKKLIEETIEKPFPQAPADQLWGAIGAVFGSWMNPRADSYRKLHDIPASWGTAVNVQSMVFGNMGDTSATGRRLHAQPGDRREGALRRVPRQRAGRRRGRRHPHAAGDHRGRAQDFGIEASVARDGDAGGFRRARQDRRAARGALPRHAGPRVHGRAREVLDPADARRQAHRQGGAQGRRRHGGGGPDHARGGGRPRRAGSADQLLHPTLDPKAERTLIARGLPASPGAATGEIVFTAEEAERLKTEGRELILVRTETSPEDINGMVAAIGVLTARGGMTSHAAVVARGMGKPCVCGAGALKIDMKAGTVAVAGKAWRAGSVITIDGATGEIFDGRVPTLQPELTGDFGTLMGWADATRRLKVRANAETPNDAKVARDFGAEGIGLCRTEHMFFEGERIVGVREMILAADSDGRRRALEKLLPMQRKDFVELFKIMSGLPVTIRLLDPPLHEFLPKSDEEIAEVAKAMKVDPALLRDRVIALTELNPMLGHRGCRLLITYPEIAEMQTRAILEAAAEAAEATGEPVTPEIMVPLVGMRSELDYVRATIDRTAKSLAANGSAVEYTVGTMIELPRAALRAQEIAEGADFFSFGTNDLTQTTFGISRDDAHGFIGHYQELGLIEKDPFVTLDMEGVGVLVRVAANEGRRAKPDLKLGICGEHGGDPASIRFCEAIGLDYVSCSPFRVPIARLAAAQAALQSAQGQTA